MAPPKNGASTTPGAEAVEALAAPGFAAFVAAALDEASEALRARYVEQQGDVGLSPVQNRTLSIVSDLGRQLVTATTPAPSGGER